MMAYKGLRKMLSIDILHFGIQEEEKEDPGSILVPEAIEAGEGGRREILSTLERWKRRR